MEPAGTHCGEHMDAAPGSAAEEAGTRQYQMLSLNQQKAMPYWCFILTSLISFHRKYGHGFSHNFT